MYKVSIIIPIYNSERYLERTINSIIRQTIGFENLELILVDDNSSDSSRDIVEKFAKQYENIVYYFSKENHGCPGFGRNLGVEMANSKYIMYCDNDDEYDSELCERLYNALIEYDADCVCCNKIRKDHISEVRHVDHYINGHEEKKGEVIIYGDDVNYFEDISIWNKIFKRDILLENNIRYIEDGLGEDFLFATEYFFNCDKLVFLKEYFGYTWYVHEESLFHNCDENKVRRLMDSVYIMDSLVKKYHKEQDTFFYLNFYLRNLFRFCIDAKMPNENLKKILKELSDYENTLPGKPCPHERWARIINYFVYKKQISIAAFLINVMIKSKESDLLRRIFRAI